MINGFSFRWHMAPTISGCFITLYYSLFVCLRSCYCYRPINPRVNIIPYKENTEISPLVTLISTTGSRKHNLFIKLGFVLQGPPCQNVYTETLKVRLLNCIRDLFFLTKFQVHLLVDNFHSAEVCTCIGISFFWQQDNG